jgi:hypothetical protein
MLELTSLPAKQGDALWIRWGNENKPHQIIIDMGTEEIGKKFRERLLSLPEEQRKIDLLVITHVDRDHIGGVLTCLAEADPIPGLEIHDVWFNGFQHLNNESVTADPGSPGLEPMGAAQGERLSTWLRQQVWNKSFDGAPVRRTPGEPLAKAAFHQGLTLTVLGPTPDVLANFIPKWQEEVAEALAKGKLSEVSPGLEAMGPREPPDLILPNDLQDLANESQKQDHSKANGSSIVLLLEYEGRKILLAGDAHHDDLIDGLQAVADDDKIHLDLFKLPHHGSKNNISKELIEAVDCDYWLISTDGTQFRHPDPVALARIIEFSTIQPPTIGFNVESTFSGWWKNPDWQAMYKYETEYGDNTDGLTLVFPHMD